MRIYSVMFASAAVPLPPPSLTTGRGAGVSFAAGVNLAPSGRCVARLIEIIVFAMLLALTAVSAPTRAQALTISSVTATPATVQPGQTVVFTTTMTAVQNHSNYPVLFSLMAPGAAPGTTFMQKLFLVTFEVGAPLTEAFSWVVPAGTTAGTYTMDVAVSAYSVTLANKTTVVTITAAGVAAAPKDLEPPVVSGTAQVGQVLSSTTGTWTGATSYAYLWAGNTAQIAGATGARYTPVSSDVGHTLTSTVTATGSSGATASATSAPTVPIVAASPGSAPPPAGSVSFVALHTYYMSPTGSDSNNGLTAATAWATPNHSVMCGDVIIAAAGSYTTGFHSWGTVSNCPSTSGGIDGTGQIYFAVVLCGGADLEACHMSSSSGDAMGVNKSNWAIEGWKSTSSGNAYIMEAAASGTTQLHHIAFVNDIAYNSQMGFQENDGALNHNVPGNGADYYAFIGDIAENAATSGYGVAGINVVAPSPWDLLRGHISW